MAAAVDLEDVRSYRNFTKSRCVAASRTDSFPRVMLNFSLSTGDQRVEFHLERQPYKLLSPEQEIRYVGGDAAGRGRGSDISFRL